MSRFFNDNTWARAVPTDQKTEIEKNEITAEEVTKTAQEREGLRESVLENQQKELSLQTNTDNNENNRGTTEIQPSTKLVGGSTEGSGVYQAISEITTLARRDSETQEGDGQESWSKIQFLRAVRRIAIKNNVWIKNIKDSFSEFLGEGTEHEAHLSQNRETVIKLNSFSRVENPQDFLTLLERFMLHNEVFPDSPYTIKGFAMDDNNNISMILEQPYVKSEEEASQSEIDTYLTNKGFTKTEKLVRGRCT